MPKKLTPIACAECGVSFEPRNTRSRFCCSTHMRRFMNRRAMRGAKMYDFVMSKRFDRAREKDARSIIDNLARAARDADKALRDGRPSWIAFDEAKAAVPLAYGPHGDQR